MKNNYQSSSFRWVLGLTTILLVFASCTNKTPKEKPSKPVEKVQTYEDTLQAQKDSLHIDSDYDMKTVDPKDQKEFIENLARIEDKYGTQWDFCTCVVKNDSVNKAFMDQTLSDLDVDRLFERSDYIDNKCQAFLVQSPNQTPDERYKHNKKVDNCLKEAGLK